jgi:DnaJ-class molecular chaperone
MQCDGKGVKIHIIRNGPMIQQTMGHCNLCRGSGSFIDETNKCETCLGERHIIKEKTIQIPLKCGLNHGDKISLEGKGHNFKNMRTDIILIINLLNNDKFRRLNDDLFIDIELKLYQALCGFDKVITHLDDRKLHISCSGKTDFNMTRKITGEGMKKINNGQKKGDLYITFKIVLPNLSLELKNQLKPILQSIDKQEVINESSITKLPDLTKTIMTDCKSEFVDKLLKEISQNDKKPNQSYHEESQQQECRPS